MHKTCLGLEKHDWQAYTSCAFAILTRAFERIVWYLWGQTNTTRQEILGVTVTFKIHLQNTKLELQKYNCIYIYITFIRLSSITFLRRYWVACRWPAFTASIHKVKVCFDSVHMFILLYYLINYSAYLELICTLISHNIKTSYCVGDPCTTKTPLTR